MSNPQQPELARSRKTPHQDQDSVAAVVEGQRQPATQGPTGPVPPENQPGHRPAHEQDKPDLDAFAERLGIGEPGTTAAERGPEGAGQPAPRPGRRRLAALVGGGVGLAGAVLALVGLLIRRRRSAG
jgi:hypothetical protein